MTQASIRRFNTQDTPDEAISALQTGREREVAYIGDIIEQNARLNEGAMQHVLVTAPRGFGKSYLTRLIDIDCRPLNQVKVVMLPEELRNVKAPADLLKEIERLTKGEDWQQVVSMWDEDDESWGEAIESLDETVAEQFSQSEGQGLLVVVVENFDVLIKQVFNSDLTQQALSDWLTRNNGRVMLLATSTGSVESQYKLPIFKLFDEMPLSPWGENQCVEYFNALRRFSQQAELSPEQLAKAKAISQFIGGNPRLARLLGGVLNSNDAVSVANTLDELVDELADYYRRLIDDLNSKANLLLDALIRQGEPCSQSELATRVGTKQSRIARAFAELHRNQIVTGKRVTGGRETLYQVTDRVFVHFYRTRYGGVKNGESPLVTIAELLKSFFTEPEKVAKTIDFFEQGMFSEGRLMTGLIEPAADGEVVVGDWWFIEFEERLYSYIDAIEQIDGQQPTDNIKGIDDTKLSLISAAKGLIAEPDISFSQCITALKRGNGGPYAMLWWLVKGYALIKELKHNAPLDCFKQALKLAGEQPELKFICLHEISFYYWDIKADIKTDLEYTKCCGQLASQIINPTLKIQALFAQARGLVELDAKQSLTIFESALTLSKEFATSDTVDGAEYSEQQIRQDKFNNKLKANIMNDISFAYTCLNSYDKALTWADEVLLLEPQNTQSKNRLYSLKQAGFALLNLGRYDEAIVRLEQAINMGKDIEDMLIFVESSHLIAECYIQLRQYEQALKFFTKGFCYVKDYHFVYKNTYFAWLTASLFKVAEHIPVDDSVEYFEQVLPLYTADDNDGFPDIGWLWELSLVSILRYGQWSELLAFYAKNKAKLSQLLDGDYLGSIEAISYELANLPCQLVQEQNIATAFACMVNFMDAIADAKQTDTYDDFFKPLVSSTMNEILTKCQHVSFLKDVGQLLANSDGGDFVRESELFAAASMYHEAGKDKAVLERVDPDVSAAIIRMLS